MLADLEKMSQIIGQKISYVQGGGGNISIKLDQQKMAIKASGWLLSDVTKANGYSIVDYPAIQNYLQTPDREEDVFTKKIMSFVCETKNRPSIETGFHALLHKCVIHTHSVYANILTCSKEGKEIALKLFPQALWVPYVTPGRELTLAVQAALEHFPEKPNIVFLENHGVIVSADKAADALVLHKTLNAIIQEHFTISEDAFNSNERALDMDFVKAHILFPDQVVFTLAGAEILKTSAAKETLAAYAFILKMIKEKSLTPCFLSSENATILLNMESEKYRQKLVK